MDRPDQQAENATEQPIAQQLNLIYLAGKQSPVSQEEEVIRKRASELIDEKIFGPRKKQFGPEPVCSTDRAAYWMERLEFGSTGDLRQNDGYLTHLELADAMKDKELTAMAVKLLTRYSSISALCNEGIERRITTRDIERLFKIDEKLSNLFRELANSHAALSELERKSVVRVHYYNIEELSGDNVMGSKKQNAKQDTPKPARKRVLKELDTSTTLSDEELKTKTGAAGAAFPTSINSQIT